jgi:lysozyme
MVELSPTQKLIIDNEGYSKTVYKCTADKSTIGYGTNLEDRGISESEALYILNNDLKRIRMNMGAHDLTGFMTPSQEAALIDMAYNLGWSGLMGFEKMIFAIKCGEYELAAEELLDSKYARQVPNRAKRNADLLAGRSEL